MDDETRLDEVEKRVRKIERRIESLGLADNANFNGRWENATNINMIFVLLCGVALAILLLAGWVYGLHYS